jgi:hypothetical protein
VTGSDRELLCIADEDLGSAQKFAPVIAIASFSEGSQKLMGMRLEYDRPGTHHFSAFASLVAFGTHLLKATMWNKVRKLSTLAESRAANQRESAEREGKSFRPKRAMNESANGSTRS